MVTNTEGTKGKTLKTPKEIKNKEKKTGLFRNWGWGGGDGGRGQRMEDTHKR